MNPRFELDQIRRYIAHLQSNPGLLKDTVESHFFPVLQRIFFREGLEVVRDQVIGDRKFPFLLKDLDLRRADVALDFQFQSPPTTSALPSFAFDWANDAKAGREKRTLLVLRNAPLLEGHLKAMERFDGAVRFLDFDQLQTFAEHAFEAYANRQQQRAAVLVVDMLDKLIEAIAVEQVALKDVHALA